MKKKDYLYQCKIDPTGRLYYGSWTHKSVLPKQLPDNEVLFEEFPDDGGSGENYLWDGKTLTYAPLPAKEDNNANNQN